MGTGGHLAESKFKIGFFWFIAEKTAIYDVFKFFQCAIIIIQ